MPNRGSHGDSCRWQRQVVLREARCTRARTVHLRFHSPRLFRIDERRIRGRTRTRDPRNTTSLARIAPLGHMPLLASKYNAAASVQFSCSFVELRLVVGGVILRVERPRFLERALIFALRGV